MTWRHTVLEIYEPDTGWPTEGKPADWIEKGLVGYCQGDTECLVALTPFWELARWKIKFWIDAIVDWVTYYLYWKWKLKRVEWEE